MMTALDRWRAEIGTGAPRVLLADDDHRAVEAAARLNAEGLVEALIVRRDVHSVEAVGDADAARWLASLAAVTDGPWAGRPLDVEDPLVVAAALVRSGWAAAAVGGATRSTSEVVRAGLRVLGTRPDVSAVSSSFFFELPDGRPLVYGDCGVVPEPTAEQLVEIAVDSAATFSQLTGETPVVALLSFSTKGSAEHPRVDKVRHAVELLQRDHPGIAADGELQFDAAWDAAVGQTKAPGSAVAGHANVFIFPDLDSGNIAYKITERLGGARAYGPLLQGFAGVFHDLSRGCHVDDLVAVSVIAAVQSQSGSRLG